jgi:hypothetical protein
MKKRYGYRAYSMRFFRLPALEAAWNMRAGGMPKKFTAATP